MKRILLILLSLSGVICFNQVKGQDGDRVVADSFYHPALNTLKLYGGFSPGYQLDDDFNHGWTTVTLNLGLNFRHYSEKVKRGFYDADLSYMPVILYGRDMYSYAKAYVGCGLVDNQYNREAHLICAYSSALSPMFVGVGYDVEAQPVIISMEYMK